MVADADAPMRILVFARAPEPGRVKTRLIPRLGPEGAARLHTRLTGLAVHRAAECALGPVELWCTPDPDHPLFADCARLPAVTLHTQPEGSLGERMAAAARRSVDAGQSALLIGTDAPALTPAAIQAAAAALRNRDAVIIPADDGGYVLLGLRRFSSRLFEDIAWGSDSVYEITIGRLAALGWAWAALEPSWDVDRPEDIDRLAAAHPELCAGLELP
jgi:rSAM/selenodomain-associated transferase 1